MISKQDKLLRLRLILEIMEARYLVAFDSMDAEREARALIHLNNAHRKIQEACK
jgi:hypothetical protein